MERQQPTPPEADIPTPLAVAFESIPERLQEHSHWVVWRYEVHEAADGEREIEKPPFSPHTGKRASVSRPETWGSFSEAQQAYASGQFAGVGIVLTPALGMVGIDINHCIETEQLSDEARQIITVLDSYTEVSPSGTGIRIMLEGKLPGAFRRSGHLEMYEEMRYVTITGHRLANTPMHVQPRHRELYSLYQHVFQLASGKKGRENTGVVVTGLRPAFATQISRSDETVLRKALAAKNGINFKRYYHGDTSLWEGAGARHTSQSEADLTLVLMLLYWTNGDASQVDRLFRQSGLMREKWTSKRNGQETYGERIISDALKKGNQ